MKPITTWVMIADGSSAKVYEHKVVGGGIALLPDQNFKATEKQTFDDAQGRSFDSVGTARHKHEPHHSEDDRFAKTLAEALERSAASNRYDRLVICASPETLGHIRPHLGKAALEKIHSEVPKNLVKTDEQELEKHLKKYLPV